MPSSESSRSPPSEFSNLAMLLRLLVLLNSKTGSAILNGTLSKRSSLDARKQTGGLSAIEGAAAILVQDHEIIATAATAGKPVVLASQSVGSSSQNQGASNGTDLDIPAIHPSSTPVVENADSRNRYSMNFTAVPNPDENTNAGKGQSKSQNPHNLRVLSPGSSLLDAVKEYQWAYALK
jgi:hypothetical protein